MNDEFANLPTEEQDALRQAMDEMERLRSAPIGYDPKFDLHTVRMTELYDTAFPPRTPLIEGLLCSGTYLFAGSPKIGKSFFMMQLAYHVATGIPLWDYPVRQGTVLYLALEDDLARLQSRLVQMFGVEPTPNLILTTQAKTIAGGLTEQIERFLQQHPDTRLVIVDTLQRIREIGSENYSYAVDYRNITTLKQYSDRYNLCLIIVHHTRKMEADDTFEMISGTTGLLGAADGAIVLQKKKRIEDTAVMQIVGRDQEDQELSLEFDRGRCYWNLIKAEKMIVKPLPDPLLTRIDEFMRNKTKWVGTAAELLEELKEAEVKPNKLTLKLNVSASALYNDFGITYTQNSRSRTRRTFTLTREPVTELGPGVSGDDKKCDDHGGI